MSPEEDPCRAKDDLGSQLYVGAAEDGPLGRFYVTVTSSACWPVAPSGKIP